MALAAAMVADPTTALATIMAATTLAPAATVVDTAMALAAIVAVIVAATTRAPAVTVVDTVVGTVEALMINVEALALAIIPTIHPSTPSADIVEEGRRLSGDVSE